MYEFIILIVIIFVVACYSLITLRLNRKQTETDLFYQYNYIPQPLLPFVKVHKLKH
ncbi:ac110-like protein [Clanis bilineata nucleopolyhedrovirus]|uniref:Ac110-like protein n=1 Tax=Clanis bilineata nucleopolyhedrovirus TaxID=1307957 RepID=Q0N411_9ABAC|nr:ac110-like protein [Clanis bilineata nucleopolyhedrovirus]ABF47432.1 ac110-like protein [Clanis bilineata nucleopolyhedrovirus]